MQEDNYVTVWHGTTVSHAARIKRDGLVPGAAAGADKWAMGHNEQIAKTIKKRKTKSVFVSSADWQASGYAYYAAEINNDKPVLLELHIPESEFMTRFKADEFSYGPDFRSETPLPASWIVGERKPLSKQLTGLEADQHA